MTIMQGQSLGRVIQNHTYKHGRWTSITFKCKENTKIMVINAYMVCQNTQTQGSSTYYMQLYRQMQHIEHKHRDVKTWCWEALTEYINEQQESGHDILLSMDLNSDISRQTSHLNSLINKCNLYDPMKHIHPELEYTSTCKTGSKRIDIILVSHTIISSIKNIYYLDYDAITYTDHKPIVINFDTTTLFKSHQTNTILTSVRILNLNNPKKMNVYTYTITEDFKKHKIKGKIEHMEHKFKTQPTITQTFSPAYTPISIKDEPFDLTQLSCDYPTSPSASVIDLLSHASEDISENLLSHASDDISEDLLPEGTLTQAMESPIINLGPYSSSTNHTQLAMKTEKK